MIYPKHVAIIPDGNRTRAKENDKTIAEAYMISYQRGVELLKYTFTHTDTKVFTLWWLSTENAQKRSKEDFDFLMNMYKLVDDDMIKFLQSNKINFKCIWDLDGITVDFKGYLIDIEAKTKCDSDKYFVFGVNYWGRDEIIRWIKKLANDWQNLKDINEEILSKSLDLWGVPPIELVIRTKWDQAQRTSGFMSRRIWYAELYFTPKKCPEFDTDSYIEALKRFDSIANLRNYGK